MTRSPAAPMELAEVCVTFDLTPRTVKYWEEVALISSMHRDGKRLYSRREIARIKLALRGRRFGMSLKEIRNWLDLYETHGEALQMEVWIHISNRQILQLEHELKQVEQAMREIRVLRRAALAAGVREGV